MAIALAAPRYISALAQRQATYAVQACMEHNLKGHCAELREKYGKCTNVPRKFKDAITSIAGDQEATCYAFREPGCTGHYFDIEANEQRPLVPADMNASISSVLCPDHQMD